MICIISGTNRKKSRTRLLSDWAAKKFRKAGEKVEIIDLAEFDFAKLAHTKYGDKEHYPEALKEVVDKINHAKGLYIICPEYNGSMPGALKFFIDFWEYPKTFEFKPVAFMGLGFRFGGLRPVEHLQQVFGYRNAFIYPERIFVQNVGDQLGEDGLKDETLDVLWSLQIERYCVYIKALKESGLIS